MRTIPSLVSSHTAGKLRLFKSKELSTKGRHATLKQLIDEATNFEHTMGKPTDSLGTSIAINSATSTSATDDLETSELASKMNTELNITEPHAWPDKMFDRDTPVPGRNHSRNSSRD